MKRLVRSLCPTAALAGFALLAGCGSENIPENIPETVSAARQAVIQNTAMSFSVPAGVSYRQVAVASSSTLLLGDRSQLLGATGGFSDASASGTTKAHLGFDTKTGSITVAASAEVMDRAVISGSIKAGQTTTFGQNGFPTPAQGNVTVSGTVQNNAAVTPLQSYTWTVPFNTSTTNVLLTTGTNNLAPGSYGSLNIQGGNLVLRAGTYYIDGITLESNGKITVDSSAGTVFVYVKSYFNHRGTWAATADKVMLGYLGTNLLALEKPFAGTVVAPNARVRYAVGGTPHQGGVFAKEVELDPDVKFTAKPFSNWGALNIDLTPRFECYQTRSDGKIAAVFGYSNPTPSTLTLPIGTDNKFTTGAQGRGQPTAFLPGSYNRAFAVAYTSGALSWTLNGSTASVTGTPSDTALQCPQPSVAIGKDTTVQSAQPTANFGTATTLSVGAGKAALVSFNRAQLKAQLGVGRIITSATLKFNIASGTATNIEALPLTSEFSETGATWNCSNDLDASNSGEHCLAYERWQLARRDGTNDNPWGPPPATPNLGTVSGTTLSFNVTSDLNRALGNHGIGKSPSWILLSSTASATLRSREAGSSVAPTLVIQTAPILDSDSTVYPPLTFNVDPTVSVRPGALPPWTAGGPARPRSGVSGPNGGVAEFTENELLVLTDDATQLSAVMTRWNATETFTQTVKAPGVPTMHVLRVDLAKAQPATLVSNALQLDNLPRGPHRVSSANGLALLSIALDEARRGTLVGVNWVPESAAVDIQAFVDNKIPEGPLDGQVPGTDSLTYGYLNYYGVPTAWKELLAVGKLKPSRKVTILDTGYDSNFMDLDQPLLVTCPTFGIPDCANILEPDKPWHGNKVVNAGFAAAGNSRGAAGPGGPVSNLHLQYSYADQAEIMVHVPMYWGPGSIINTSHSVPVPATFSGVNIPGEMITRAARKQHDTLIFASAGNKSTNIDATDCFLGICWEETWWFPCENDGVNCVGATPGLCSAPNANVPPFSSACGTDAPPAADSIAAISNYGASVDYFGAGGVLALGDATTPLSPTGAIHGLSPATSFSSPFVAGVAALTWAADTTKSAGQVESCLSSTSTVATAGGNHRVVNAARAVSCALGSPANFAPAVQITTPADGIEAGLGINSARALAIDVEDGTLNSIGWSLNGTSAGSSASGQTLAYGISAPGIQTLTASVSDSSGAPGSATVKVSVTPAPPILRIVNPATDGQPFQLGFPITFLVEQTDYKVSPPACSSFKWDGWNSANAPIFNGWSGCLLEYETSVFGLGTSRVTASLTAFGLTGTATRTATVVDDGKLHVRIFSPTRPDNVGTITNPRYGLEIQTTNGIAFASKIVPTDRTVTYRWSYGPRGGPQTVVPNNDSPYLFWGPAGGNSCRDSYLDFWLVVTDTDGNQADDVYPVKVHNPCTP
ncbi:MAG TPA: DNRLRE domain-containing protein [Polyangiaceae bacterium]|nr:DNRLRE domain-containing protein [Polyangiaceae bacterium]